MYVQEHAIIAFLLAGNSVSKPCLLLSTAILLYKDAKNRRVALE
jgi:hypothetical protein